MPTIFKITLDAKEYKQKLQEVADMSQLNTASVNSQNMKSSVSAAPTSTESNAAAAKLWKT